MITQRDRGTLYVETGGYSIGYSVSLSMHGTWPFARFYIFDDRLVIKAFFRTYTFPRDVIEQVSIIVGVTSFGLRIERQVKEYPQYVVFWSSDITQLREHLEEAAYHVCNANI